jgi:hypothetical protein
LHYMTRLHQHRITNMLAAARTTVVIAGVPVQTTVTARPALVRRWVHTTRWRLRSCGDPTVVGLGVQWTPQFRAGADERPDTLQLCAGRRCLVFQISRAGGRVPRVLRRFLADSSVTFAGYNVEADCDKLRAHYGLVVACKMELRRASGMGNASLAEMAARLLGIRGLTKSRKIGMSNWCASTLSKKQVRYACVDAYLSYRLGVHLRHNGDDTSSSCSDDDDETSSEDDGGVHLRHNGDDTSSSCSDDDDDETSSGGRW